MTQSEILHMRISADLRDGIDELRRREPDLPSKSEMVRRLVMRALASPARLDTSTPLTTHTDVIINGKLIKAKQP